MLICGRPSVPSDAHGTPAIQRRPSLSIAIRFLEVLMETPQTFIAASVHSADASLRPGQV